MPQPIKKFKAGGISATIWANKGKTPNGEETTYNSITIDRRYKDKNGDWQSTNSVRPNDLPKVELVSRKAYAFLMLDEDNTEQQQEAPVEVI